MSGDFVVLNNDVTVASAWQTLFASGCTHALVTQRGRCVAVIDDRLIALEWPSGAFETRRRLVTSVVGVPPVTVLPDTDAEDVAVLMASERVGAVAVVDPIGHPLGLVRCCDVVAAAARFGLGTLPQRVGVGDSDRLG